MVQNFLFTGSEIVIHLNLIPSTWKSLSDGLEDHQQAQNLLAHVYIILVSYQILNTNYFIISNNNIKLNMEL